jgi:adenosylmethionine-8-amino-7-oxononanoate aminotransferase
MIPPSWLVEGAPHVWRPYCQHQTAPDPLAVVSADGCRLRLADGRELLDGLASWWTVAHGYRHPHLQEAIARQLATLPHVAFGGLAHEAAYTLALRLAALLPPPLSRVFFVESGSVAVEVALKICLQSFANRGQPERRQVLAFSGSYHGDTLATMALCDPVDGMHRAFSGLMPLALHARLPHAASDEEAWSAIEALFARHASTLAAVVIEPLLQAAGGMRLHPPAVLKRLRALCDAHGVLLVFDEIATGFFRIGARFALEEAGVVPDVITLGKALTGGTLPLACAVASETLFESFLGDEGTLALQHGPTFMGKALACAAAHASLDLFEREDYARRVAHLEVQLRRALEPLSGLPGVQAVRCKGAMGAIELPSGAAPPSSWFVDHGVFVRPLRLHQADVVYLMPPLVVDDEELTCLTAALARSLETAGGAAGQARR